MSIADFECAEIGFSHELDFYMPTMPERVATRERYVKHRVYSGVGEARLSGAVGFC